MAPISGKTELSREYSAAFENLMFHSIVLEELRLFFLLELNHGTNRISSGIDGKQRNAYHAMLILGTSTLNVSKP